MLFCLLLANCAPTEGPPVRFVVPDGYLGPFEILQEKGAGEVILEHGEFVYRVPTNGMLKVAQVVGFTEWHKADAFFASGTPIPVKLTSEREQVPAELALYELWNTRTRYKFFVGSQAEMAAYVKEPVLETEGGRFLAGQWRTNQSGTLTNR